MDVLNFFFDKFFYALTYILLQYYRSILNIVANYRAKYILKLYNY